MNELQSLTQLSLVATPLYLGLNLVLTAVLAAMVIRRRITTETNIGDGDNKLMKKAVRAHGNNTEFMPGAMVMICVLELIGTNPMLVHGLGILFLAARLSHAWGLYSNLGASPGRFLGTLGSLITYFVGAVTLLIYAVGKL